MEYVIVWGGDPEDPLITTSRGVTVDALDEFTQAALSDPRYRPGMAVIVDHRNADWSEMTTADLRRRVDLLAHDAGRARLSLEVFLDMASVRSASAAGRRTCRASPRRAGPGR